MDALKLVPQLFFDLIARVIPGAVGLFLIIWMWPDCRWSALLSHVAVNHLDKDNAFAFAFFVPLGLGYVIGHLIAPIGKWLRQLTAREPVTEPWRQYDWLRVHRPDAGALAAKIRAEYTMHFSLAAAFLLGLLIGIYSAIVVPDAVSNPWWRLIALISLMALSLYRGHETVKTFCSSVNNLYAVAQERVPPPGPPWSDEQPPPGGSSS